MQGNTSTQDAYHTLMKHLRASRKVACRFAIKSASKTCSARPLAGTPKMQRKVPKSAYEKADSKRKVTAAIKRKSIGFFFKKDENATCLPGKRDTVKVDGKRIQKYILNDSIRVLYKKYNFENPNQNISLTLFQECSACLTCIA